jgi:hypothetical protein
MEWLSEIDQAPRLNMAQLLPFVAALKHVSGGD